MRGRWMLGVVCLVVAPAGCGGGSAVDRAPVTPSCETRVPAGHPADTVTVVLFETVDLSHAPWGRNREERFVFSHLYETLVTIDCHGEVQPGLAKSCKPASDGWLLELRDDAHFWDESAVTTRDVVASFEAAIHDGIAIESIDVIDERRVLVHGQRGRPDLKLFALPMLSVTRKSDTPGPPMGTGAWLIDEDAPVAEAIVMIPASGAGPVVRFVQGNVSDARDIMDGPADAIITDDPTAIEYARSRSRTVLAPLAWDRAYMLLSTSRSQKIDEGALAADVPPSVCDALARDAVRVDARGGSVLAIESEKACRARMINDFAGHAASGPFAATKRVMFPSDDPTARNLAERIVALAAMDTASSSAARAIVQAVPSAGQGMRAVGASPVDFALSLRTGDEFAYVSSLSWCADFPLWVGGSDWANWLYTSWPVSSRLIPLVETRAHFVALSDRVGFVDDHAGNVRILIPPRRESR